MATTTPQAFNEFKALLKLTDTQRTLVKSRRDTTHKYLTAAFPPSSSLPLRTTKLIGSAGRGTIIRPLDDIDVLAVFNNRDDIFDSYRYDSRKFLYRVRDAMKDYSSVSVVGARGQAVRFFYADRPHVDIAPVFAWDSGGYALPDGSGGWLTTDPDEHERYFSERDAQLNSRLKPMIRMVKRWNNVHSKRLKSFHLEVMAATMYSSIGSDSRNAAERFFEWAPNYVSIADPAGHSSDLSGYLTWNQRREVVQSFASARETAARANDAEIKGDHQEAIRLWGIVFGSEFPTYG